MKSMPPFTSPPPGSGVQALGWDQNCDIVKMYQDLFLIIPADRMRAVSLGALEWTNEKMTEKP